MRDIKGPSLYSIDHFVHLSVLPYAIDINNAMSGDVFVWQMFRMTGSAMFRVDNCYGLCVDMFV